MASPNIFKGVWINWSKGSVLGRSVTIDNNSGQYLISATATFVQLVGGFIWLLIAYFLHQYLVASHPSDAFLSQRQVLLRNSQEPLSTVQELLGLFSTWSLRTCLCFKAKLTPPSAQALKRCSVPLILVALFVWTGFVVLGVVSAQVAPPSSSSSNVVITSQNCGIWTFNEAELSGIAAADHKVLNDTLAGRAYARACYAGDASYSSIISCVFFTQKNLTYQASALDGQCPFGAHQSSSNLGVDFRGGDCDTLYNTGAHTMATELLGINAPPKNRILFRKVVTCSPLSIANRTSTSNGPFCNTPSCSKGNLTAYNFGPIKAIFDYTYLYNPASIQDNVGYEMK